MTEAPAPQSNDTFEVWLRWYYHHTRRTGRLWEVAPGIIYLDEGPERNNSELFVDETRWQNNAARYHPADLFGTQIHIVELRGWVDPSYIRKFFAETLVPTVPGLSWFDEPRSVAPRAAIMFISEGGSAEHKYYIVVGEKKLLATNQPQAMRLVLEHANTDNLMLIPGLLEQIRHSRLPL